ncbi:MAG: hypothetical protein EXR78_09965 [Deltaproteobacteria bacterium]|nr:hypothetical protein [Deltaproteobacteria bacterium]
MGHMNILERYESPDGHLTLLVTEEAGDITIGFDDYPWHTHADLLAAEYGLSESEAVRTFVDQILRGEAVIAILSIQGVMCEVWITTDPTGEIPDVESEEQITFRRWGGKVSDA